MADFNTLREAIFRRLTENPTTGCVVALSGPWGCGKTHLWREIAKDFQSQSKKTAYASLFGLNALAEVRTAIVTSALARTSSSQKLTTLEKVKEKAAASLPALLKVFDDQIGIPILANVVDPLALVGENLVVCLDDLERIAERSPHLIGLFS